MSEGKGDGKRGQGKGKAGEIEGRRMGEEEGKRGTKGRWNENK